MSDEGSADTGPPEGAAGRQRSEAERSRRRAAVFGDVLPDRTDDERDEPDSDPAGAVEGSDQWLRQQVPPHHG